MHFVYYVRPLPPRSVAPSRSRALLFAHWDSAEHTEPTFPDTPQLLTWPAELDSGMLCVWRARVEFEADGATPTEKDGVLQGGTLDARLVDEAPRDGFRLLDFDLGLHGIGDAPASDDRAHLVQRWAEMIQRLRQSPKPDDQDATYKAEFLRAQSVAADLFLADLSEADPEPEEPALGGVIEAWLEDRGLDIDATEPSEAEAELRQDLYATLGAALVVEAEWEWPTGVSSDRDFFDRLATHDALRVRAPREAPKGLDIAVHEGPLGFELVLRPQSTERAEAALEDLGPPRLRILRRVGAEPQPERMEKELPSELPWSTVDTFGPHDHLDELIHWRLEVLDDVGQVAFAGEASARRRRCFTPPDAVVRVTQTVDDEGQRVEATVEVPTAAFEDATQLRVELYHRARPLAPSGFYGDEDDIAVLEGLRSMDLFYSEEAKSAGEPAAADDDDDLEALLKLTAGAVPRQEEGFDPLLHSVEPMGPALPFDRANVPLGKWASDTPDAPSWFVEGRSHEVYYRTVRLGPGDERWRASPLRRCPLSLEAQVPSRDGDIGSTEVALPYLERIALQRSTARPFVDGVVGQAQPVPAAEDSDEETGHRVYLTWPHATVPGAAAPGGYRVYIRDTLSSEDTTSPFRRVQQLQVLQPRVFACMRPTFPLPEGGWADSAVAGKVTTGDDANAVLVRLVEELTNDENAPYRLLRPRWHPPQSASEAEQALALLEATDRHASEHLHAIERLGFAVWLVPKAAALDALVATYDDVDGDPSPDAASAPLPTALKQAIEGEPAVSVVQFESPQGYELGAVLLAVVPGVKALAGLAAEWDAAEKGAYENRVKKLKSRLEALSRRHRLRHRDGPLLRLPLGRAQAHAGTSSLYAGAWARWRHDAFARDPWAHRLEVAVEPLGRYALFDGTFGERSDQPMAPSVPGEAATVVRLPRSRKVSQRPAVIAEPSPNRTAMRYRITVPDELRAAQQSALRRLRLGSPQLEHDADRVACAYVGAHRDKLVEMADRIAEAPGAGPSWDLAPRDDGEPAEDAPAAAETGTLRIDHLNQPYWFEATHRARVVTDGGAGVWAEATTRRLPSRLALPRLPWLAPLPSGDEAPHGSLVLSLALPTLGHHLDEETWASLNEARRWLRVGDVLTDAPASLVRRHIHALPDLNLRFEVQFADGRAPAPRTFFGWSGPGARRREGPADGEFSSWTDAGWANIGEAGEWEDTKLSVNFTLRIEDKLAARLQGAVPGRTLSPFFLVVERDGRRTPPTRLPFRRSL